MNLHLHAGESGGDDRALGNLYRRSVLDDRAIEQKKAGKPDWEA